MNAQDALLAVRSREASTILAANGTAYVFDPEPLPALCVTRISPTGDVSSGIVSEPEIVARLDKAGVADVW